MAGPNPQQLTQASDAISMRDFLTPLSNDAFVNYYRKAFRAPTVIHTASRESITNEILEFRARDPIAWVYACLLAGVDTQDFVFRTENLDLYVAMTPTYLQHEKSIIEAWEIWPANPNEPERSKPLLPNDIWKLTRSKSGPTAPHPHCLEFFLRSRPYFKVSLYVNPLDGIGFHELSDLGLQERQRIDTRKRRRKWLASLPPKAKRIWRVSVSSTKHPLIYMPVLTLFFWFLSTQCDIHLPAP